MSSTETAYINHKILAWAIERRELTYAQVAKSARIPERYIRAWAEGQVPIPFDKAQSLANSLKIPFGFLYLDEPPPIEIPLPDLRTLERKTTFVPSIDFLDLLHSVISQHEWYKEYLLEKGANPLPFVSRFSPTKNTISEVAQDIRKTLDIGEPLRRQSNDRRDFLHQLIKIAEEIGIIVMRRGIVGSNTRRPIFVEEFQGIAITDNIAPLVCINSRDFTSAKIFTLLHELAHIWIGQSGISFAKEDETELEKRRLDIEDFCNAVAAETLVPQDTFRRYWKGTGDFEEIEHLANRFLVSTLVILRRARELGLITVPSFISFLEESSSRIKKKPKAKGGNANANLDARNSVKFVQAVISDVRFGLTTYRDGARLLSLKVPAFTKIMEGAKT